jgi:hypothetical protein
MSSVEYKSHRNKSGRELLRSTRQVEARKNRKVLVVKKLE